jgi:hypothetical protein
LSVCFTDEYLLKFTVSGVPGQKLAMKETQACRLVCGKLFFSLSLFVDRTKTFKLQNYTKTRKAVISR